MNKGPVSELARSIDCGSVKRDDYARDVLKRVERATSLNAFTSRLDDDELLVAIAEPDRGPLASLPFSVKDNILTADFPTSVGTDTLSQFNPGTDAELVRRLQALGGVLVGKNNMPELCQSMTCNNPTYGPVLNPVNPEWIAGGSSGGSAVAVATGAVAFAIGSDTGGSVRIPASLCGCVGFRPTIGRYSTDGFFPVSPTFDAPGLLAPSSEDIRWLDRLIIDNSAADEAPAIDLTRMRIGLPRAYFCESLAPDVEKNVDTAVNTLKSAGVAVVEENIDGVAELNQQVGFPIAFYEMLRETAVFLARHNAGVSLEQLLEGIKGPVEKQALSAQLFEMAVDRPTYLRALTVNLPAYVQLIDDYFSRYDLHGIIVPTTPLPAVDHRPPGTDGEVTLNGQSLPTFLAYIRNVEPFSNFGGPSITLPIAGENERPVGLELIGRRGGDRDLLNLAVAAESVLGRK